MVWYVGECNNMKLSTILVSNAILNSKFLITSHQTYHDPKVVIEKLLGWICFPLVKPYETMAMWICIELNRNYWQKMWIKSWNLHWKFSLLVWTLHIYGHIVVKLLVIVLHKMSDNSLFYIVCNFCELEPYVWNFGWTMIKFLVFNRIVKKLNQKNV